VAAQNMPAAEVEVTERLVRDLVVDQHPDLAELPLRGLANGWDYVIFRLGYELTVRLPRRAMAADLVEHEQRWLPRLADRLPIPIPAPVRLGQPALGYPWRWSVCPWFDGTVAAETALADAAR
jgi:aminoglycoside phosphotransferase (APT) family kinase protein